jgi:hypothetical protein
VDRESIARLLRGVKAGRTSVNAALEALKRLPIHPVGGFARLDTHRALRQGFPEVVFAEGKTAAQVARIAREIAGHGQTVLVTRLDAAKVPEVQKAVPLGRYDPASRTFRWKRGKPPRTRGKVVVACAGTSDIPVAEEAAITAEVMGNAVERHYDVGVAGIHRVLRRRDAIANAKVVIVVAGMEGALPSVVGGLTDRPVVAVPTSVGYGAAYGGLAALLGMMNSCSPNVAVVNVDNGFGAGFFASLVNRK